MGEYYLERRNYCICLVLNASIIYKHRKDTKCRIFNILMKLEHKNPKEEALKSFTQLA